MSDVPLLDLAHISKRFGNKVALRDVSIQVTTGECVALLGANGAGKSTLLRTMATLSRPTRGSVRAFGVDAWQSRTQVRARLGVVAHQPYVYLELSCRENLRFFGQMFALDNLDERVEAVLEQVGLAARTDDRAATLSRGLLQRLNLARAILHKPGVLILDEPDTGLDAAGRAVLSAIMARQRASGGCVVLTTHALDYALEHATRVVTLSGGRVLFDAARSAVDISHLRDAIDADFVLAGA